jgi:hypothetical protein
MNNDLILQKRKGRLGWSLPRSEERRLDAFQVILLSASYARYF